MQKLTRRLFGPTLFSWLLKSSPVNKTIRYSRLYSTSHSQIDKISTFIRKYYQKHKEWWVSTICTVRRFLYIAQPVQFNSVNCFLYKIIILYGFNPSKTINQDIKSFKIRTGSSADYFSNIFMVSRKILNTPRKYSAEYHGLKNKRF